MRVIFILLICLNLFAVELVKPKVYKGSEDIIGWYMSEKLDGIRGYWDGKTLRTRKGNLLYPPKWFIKDFPPFELDGELWTKRDNFENIQSIVMDKTPSKNWNQITYNIFEVPNAKGGFTIRLTKLKSYLYKNPNKYIKVIQQIPCKSSNHLHKFLDKIISLKGEGVIIKDSTLSYHTGRSPHILKVKKAQDMEGRVIAVNYSKKTNVMKNITLKLQNNVIFNLGGGFSNIQRKNPPYIGDTVTFKYYGFTKNDKPKFASFLHVRKD